MIVIDISNSSRIRWIDYRKLELGDGGEVCTAKQLLGISTYSKTRSGRGICIYIHPEGIYAKDEEYSVP